MRSPPGDALPIHVRTASRYLDRREQCTERDLFDSKKGDAVIAPTFAKVQSFGLASPAAPLSRG